MLWDQLIESLLLVKYLILVTELLTALVWVFIRLVGWISMFIISFSFANYMFIYEGWKGNAYSTQLGFSGLPGILKRWSWSWKACKCVEIVLFCATKWFFIFYFFKLKRQLLPPAPHFRRLCFRSLKIDFLSVSRRDQKGQEFGFLSLNFDV